MISFKFIECFPLRHFKAWKLQRPNYHYYSLVILWKILLTECNNGTTQKLSCGVSNMTELNNTITTSDCTSILPSQNIPRQMSLLSDVVVNNFDLNRIINSKWAIFVLPHYRI